MMHKRKYERSLFFCRAAASFNNTLQLTVKSVAIFAKQNTRHFRLLLSLVVRFQNGEIDAES
jgi:hypothetical protein